MEVIDLEKVEKAKGFHQAGEDDFKARRYLCAYNNFKIALMYHPGNKLYEARIKETEWFVVREKADNVFRKGVFNESLQKFDEAEKCYREAVKLNPNKAIYHHYLSALLLYGPSANAEEGALFCKHALDIEPENIDIIFTFGEIQKSLGKVDEAKKTFSRILELDPENTEAKEELSRL